MDNYKKILETIYEKLDKPEVYVMAFLSGKSSSSMAN